MSVAGTENVGWRRDSSAENSEKEDIVLGVAPEENKRLNASLRWQSRATSMGVMAREDLPYVTAGNSTGRATVPLAFSRPS